MFFMFITLLLAKCSLLHFANNSSFYTPGTKNECFSLFARS